MTTDAQNDALIASLRPSAQASPVSGIVEVFNYGRTREGLIPLWAGEGDTPTPPIIYEAAARSLADGETFYTYQLGIPPLREALAGYFQSLYHRPFSPDEFFVTCGGMQAIQIAMQLTVGVGDEVVVLSPAWPNFAGGAIVQGAEVRYVPLDHGDGGWTLDLDRLFDACGPKTKALVINSPANPSGWAASEAELRAILTFAREKGLWIIADEIYGRFYYDGEVGAGVAPSLQTMREPHDRILFAQTFSKNWAMTGWRIGWLQGPAALAQIVENHIQYNTSGVAPFMQRAGIAAIEHAGDFAQGQIDRATQGRAIICDTLGKFANVRFKRPAGAFYAFFSIEGHEDSMATAFRLVDEANIGLAPGVAFGPGAEAFYRICYLRSPEALREAMQRLGHWLEKQNA
ncbi:MAG: pyridoxal phosphate-dependent aminotransferase [Hyphomicrobiaceae bacterium]